MNTFSSTILPGKTIVTGSDAFAARTTPPVSALPLSLFDGRKIRTFQSNWILLRLQALRMVTSITLLAAFSFIAASVYGSETDGTNVLRLLPQAAVDSQGVYLDQIVAEGAALPHVRLADSPAFGQVSVITRAAILSRMQEAAPDLVTNLAAGGDRVRIIRRSRMLAESEIKDWLLVALQRNYVRDQGELELRLNRPWTALRVPDEPLEIKILDVPASGISPNFITRFELRASAELIGNWQVVLQARVWRDIWVASTTLKRGQPLGASDVSRERRDVLVTRDALANLPEDLSTVEVAEGLAVGTALTVRSIRQRPLVHRGEMVEAVVQEGALNISLKVEVMEEGALGQTIRIRNPQTRREFRGKVQNEQTILVSL